MKLVKQYAVVIIFAICVNILSSCGSGSCAAQKDSTPVINSTIFISNQRGNGALSNIIGCKIDQSNGDLSNCSIYSSESYFGGNLSRSKGIAVSGNKLYTVDIYGSAVYKLWKCNLDANGAFSSECQGYTAESLGLSSSDLQNPSGMATYGKTLYISAQKNGTGAYIYLCNLDSNNDVTTCSANNLAATNSIYVTPVAANANNLFTLYHDGLSAMNVGTISCNPSVTSCNVESSANVFSPLKNLTGITLSGDNVFLVGNNYSVTFTSESATLLRCNNSISSCQKTGPDLASLAMFPTELGVNNNYVYIPLINQNISSPIGKIDICNVMANSFVSDNCLIAESSTVVGLEIPMAVTFYNR